MNTGKTTLDAKGARLLKDVDPRLKKLFEEVALQNGHQFFITEGARSAKRQLELFNRGASKLDGQSPRTLSQHQLGRAVDVAMWDSSAQAVSWAWPPYYSFATLVKQIAGRNGIEIEWGGDWKTFKDGPHFQLKPGT